MKKKQIIKGIITVLYCSSSGSAVTMNKADVNTRR